MSTHTLSNVSSKFGAPMGRASSHNPEAVEPKLRMALVRVDAGGYDSGGAYWGVGLPLYHVTSDDGGIEMFPRGRSREDAKREVRGTYPTARFYR